MQTSLQQNQTFTVDIFQTDNLQEWVDMFLYACRSRNLARSTIQVYTKKLFAFIKFCSDVAITDVRQITPDTIRMFLIYLKERHHRPAAIHCYFRALKTFLRWYEAEVEPDSWKNPIEKVKAPVRRLREDHQRYDSELSQLNTRGFLTADDHWRISELKKLKLIAKDRMEAILRQARAAAHA